MKTIEISEATGSVADYAKQASRSPVILTSRGKLKVAIIDISDVDEESLSLSLNPKFIAMLRRSRERLKREGGIPLEAARRRLGLSPKRRKR